MLKDKKEKKEKKEKTIDVSLPPADASLPPADASLPFQYLSLEEATNNLEYYRELLVHHFNLKPVECFLTATVYGGQVRTIWDKQVTASYKVSFTTTPNAIPCIAIDQTDKIGVNGLTMVRLLTDLPFDVISHVLTLSLRDKEGLRRWVIFKPFDKDSSYYKCKLNTQKKIATQYNKVFFNPDPA
jgi:hypothetical protein